MDNNRIHDWYRFVLAFSDQLVTSVIARFNLEAGATVLDPFVGTGTTLVECQKIGIHGIGLDANPLTAFASRVKTNWDIDLAALRRKRTALLRRLRSELAAVATVHQPLQLSFLDLEIDEASGIYEARRRTSHTDVMALIPKGAINPQLLERTLVIRDAIFDERDQAISDLFLLALAAVTVEEVSNLSFGPEVYVSKQRKDADVYGLLVRRLQKIEADLEAVQALPCRGRSQVYHADARALSQYVTEPVDSVITSPPYPNEKDYTRITRLEMVLLGFIRDKKDLRALKQGLLRSNTRNVFVQDDDARYVRDVPQLVEIAAEIERRRLAKNANSGFERLYPRVVLEYFGGMYRVLAELEKVMRRGAKAAIVVGDQMSYFRVPIQTAELLAEIVNQKGLKFKVLGVDEWRTRKATATRMDIREAILFLSRK
jgi:DNA modification methylase